MLCSAVAELVVLDTIVRRLSPVDGTNALVPVAGEALLVARTSSAVDELLLEELREEG